MRRQRGTATSSDSVEVKDVCLTNDFRREALRSAFPRFITVLSSVTMISNCDVRHGMTGYERNAGF